jgi:hypothetical protein
MLRCILVVGPRQRNVFLTVQEVNQSDVYRRHGLDS